MLGVDLSHSVVQGRRVWRYQRGTQNPYIEEEQTTQWWQKEKVQKDKQRSTKHTHKTKDRVTRVQPRHGRRELDSPRSVDTIVNSISSPKRLNHLNVYSY